MAWKRCWKITDASHSTSRTLMFLRVTYSEYTLRTAFPDFVTDPEMWDFLGFKLLGKMLVVRGSCASFGMAKAAAWRACTNVRTMTSITDHLRSHEYERIRRSKSVLAEPRVSDEDAQCLLEAYERSDTTAAEYLEMVTKNRPFTPSSTSYAVIIDSGTYLALVEKAPSGRILVHVRSSDAAKKLVVKLLGRKFLIKNQSPFDNKFYMNLFGVRSVQAANKRFLGLAAIEARPYFMTPGDVNMEAHVTTPTWRFYFGQEDAPTCLKVHGFVTYQLICDRKRFSAKGKRSQAPPERAVAFRTLTYAPGADQLDEEMHSAPSDMETEVANVYDVDMTINMETGFKRVDHTDASFVDENPYAVLETLDCDFEEFEPQASDEVVPGMLLTPRLSWATSTNEPLPIKRRSTNLSKPASVKLTATEAVITSAEETNLEALDDRVTQNMQHLDDVKPLSDDSKNMDKIIVSMKSMPTAWSTVVCSGYRRWYHGRDCLDPYPESYPSG
ncbi:hypothetical protein ON010_g7853 [Phytophthora cinnamomi]|nr:hypothetical protein ON010_g7853 [Phytophthora cinnamomi]